MSKHLKALIRHYFNEPNYLFLLVSMVILIVLPPFAVEFQYTLPLMNITYGVVILMAAIFTSSSYRELFILFVLGAILYTAFLFSQHSGDFGLINAILSLAFFSFVFVKILQYILRKGEITLNDVYACVCGYLILGIVATPFISLISQLSPTAFKVPAETSYYDYIYFSYITLTTVGYGDITPIHPLAKSFSILLSIFGQLYLAIIVAIIIGKFLMLQNTSDDND